MAVTLQQLEIFRAVARNLSFSVAAREVYTSQPHVSNQIRKLEEHYRVPLFVRSRPGVTLTEAGAALYERISAILTDIEDAERVVEQFRGLRRGSVTVAATASIGSHVLPGVLADFRRQHPEIVVRLHVSNTEEVLAMIERDDAEIAITPARPMGRDLESQKLCAEELVVISPPHLKLPPHITLDVLAAQQLVVREDGSLTLGLMNELLADRDLDYAAHLSGTTAVNEAVAAGMGVALVPGSSTRPWEQAGAVCVSRLSDASPSHQFFLVHFAHRYITPATRALMRHLRSWDFEDAGPRVHF